jgi:hypothetical protein
VGSKDVFEDLKTVEIYERPFESFHAAAHARGLIRDAETWDEAIRDLIILSQKMAILLFLR